MQSPTAVNLDESAQAYAGSVVKGWEKLYDKKIRNLYQSLKRYALPGNVLEMGCADGAMTELICRDFPSLTVVDGSEVFLGQVRERLQQPGINWVHSYFEEYEPAQPFHTIFATHILEHLDDPIAVLKRAMTWLVPGGRMLIDVPNADSLHRLIGVKMGLLPTKDSLNEQDKILGHQRVYTKDLLLSHVEAAGFKVVAFGGAMVKPLSNRQIEATWSDELIDAYIALGEDLPELCSEIYVVAEKP